jgi:hypothetical protein
MAHTKIGAIQSGKAAIVTSEACMTDAFLASALTLEFTLLRVSFAIVNFARFSFPTLLTMTESRITVTMIGAIIDTFDGEK